MKIKDIPFRNDDYGTRFFVTENGKTVVLPVINGRCTYGDTQFELTKEYLSDVLHFSINVNSSQKSGFERCGLRLGVDCYMSSYPEWNKKFFPTSLRCEKNGFWGCFVSPEGTILAVASPSKIVSWANEYKRLPHDVGHRIFTSSVDFVNRSPQPERHPVKTAFEKGEKAHYDLYFAIVADRRELYSFVNKYAGIEIPYTELFVLEKDKTPLPYGRNIISGKDCAETSVYVRKDWFYYLDAARKDAEICQQKPGTHTESWYGFFTLAAYAKHLQDKSYTQYVAKRFDSFFQILTKKNLLGKTRLRKKALPHRLQNVSCMISLLCDMYELTSSAKYLDYAADLADFLMTLQAKDGSYRNHSQHYTCVIYPAKSMLELVEAERASGRNKLADRHFASAEKAITDLYRRLDDIGTEGEMTFEDGMLTCEALQLAFYATFCEGEKRKNFTQAAEYILKKHLCLEQKFIPDCRTFGATLRFWEARYDINFNANMLNTPHGWTSWKTYATYYLYLLTANPDYLVDTVNTMGACVQTIDEKGELNWAFVPDPCVSGTRMVKADNKLGFSFEKQTVGECYLPKISQWYRQPEGTMPMQYIRYFDKPSTWEKDLGGSCDNDVHEHFKCLDETLFGKAFVHISDDKELLFNCKKQNGIYSSSDPYVDTFVVYSQKPATVNIDGVNFDILGGIRFCRTK